MVTSHSTPLQPSWRVVTWNSRTDREFSTRQEALDYITMNDDTGHWHIEPIPTAKLILDAAEAALRAYEYGNSDPTLAKNTADAIRKFQRESPQSEPRKHQSAGVAFPEGDHPDRLSLRDLTARAKDWDISEGRLHALVERNKWERTPLSLGDLVALAIEPRLAHSATRPTKLLQDIKYEMQRWQMGAPISKGHLDRLVERISEELATADSSVREPDNVGDSDRWEDPRDISGGATDATPSTRSKV